MNPLGHWPLKTKHEVDIAETSWEALQDVMDGLDLSDDDIRELYSRWAVCNPYMVRNLLSDYDDGEAFYAHSENIALEVLLQHDVSEAKKKAIEDELSHLEANGALPSNIGWLSELYADTHESPRSYTSGRCLSLLGKFNRSCQLHVHYWITVRDCTLGLSCLPKPVEGVTGSQSYTSVTFKTSNTNRKVYQYRPQLTAILYGRQSENLEVIGAVRLHALEVFREVTGLKNPSVHVAPFCDTTSDRVNLAALINDKRSELEELERQLALLSS